MRQWLDLHEGRPNTAKRSMYFQVPDSNLKQRGQPHLVITQPLELTTPPRSGIDQARVPPERRTTALCR